MLQPARHRTWAPRGETPIQHVSARHDRRVSVIGALFLTPKQRQLGFAFHALQETVKTHDIIWFLTAMHRHFRHKVILVWDRLNPHRSAAKWFNEKHPDWFQFEWLPPYAPELNPVEQCWAHSKRVDLANYCPHAVDELEATARRALNAKRSNQRLLRSWFAHAKLNLP